MTKTMSTQPHRIDSGDDMTTNTTTTAVMEKKTRACKRKDCGDADTTNTETKKRACRRKDCGDTDTTNTSTATETKKRACRRKECAGTSTPTVTEKKKIAYGSKDCGDTDTTNASTATETKKRACRRKNCGDTDMTNTSTATEREKRACRRKECAGTSTPTLTEKKRASKRKDCGNTANTSTATDIQKKRACRRKDCGDTENMSTAMEIQKKTTCRRKDSGDTTNTSTAMEIQKKRACRKQDCGGTNTPTIMEMKKRPYTRKYSTESTNTSTATVINKERACRRKDSGDTANTSTAMEIPYKRAYRKKKFLPHDLIVEQILTKLPVPTLLKSVRVSKLWYNSIHNDHKRLTYSHFLQSQKQPQVIFSLLNVRNGVCSRTGDASYACQFFKFATADYPYKNILRFNQFRNSLTHPDISQLVGYCNGLPCMAQVGNYSTSYMILDPNRNDFLFIFYPARVGIWTPNAHIICHGFGFDPLANEYKLVSIYGTAENELNIVVFTLGTKSWRNITATSMPMSAHGCRPVTKLRAPTGSDRSAIFCTSSSSSGCLVWKIVATSGGEGSNHIQQGNCNAVNNEMEMLLSFNLHDEKFQFVQLPAKHTTDEQQKHTLVDYPHLLEFKGSPCIARIEKVSGNGSDYPHRCRDDHQGSGICCCCCKVHLYILKDKVKQAWVKEETFDVCINSTPRFLRDLGKLFPDPCCFCLSSTTTPPTRIFSFSDQILLYWFNGKYLQVYNLRSGKIQHVVPTCRVVNVIFRAKIKEPRHTFIPGDDVTYCSNMDYQLHRHEENFLSLETFIPEGVEGIDAQIFRELDLESKDHPCSAYVRIYRGSKVFYPWFT